MYMFVNVCIISFPVWLRASLTVMAWWRYSHSTVITYTGEDMQACAVGGGVYGAFATPFPLKYL